MKAGLVSSFYAILSDPLTVCDTFCAVKVVLKQALMASFHSLSVLFPPPPPPAALHDLQEDPGCQHVHSGAA